MQLKLKYSQMLQFVSQFFYEPSYKLHTVNIMATSVPMTFDPEHGDTGWHMRSENAELAYL
jgi:hypothetical protein